MSENKFKNGDLVHIVKKNEKEDPYVMYFDRYGYKSYKVFDSSEIFEVDITNVMPIRQYDGIDGYLYPLTKSSSSHKKKIYVNENDLELVENIWKEEYPLSDSDESDCSMRNTDKFCNECNNKTNGEKQPLSSYEQKNAWKNINYSILVIRDELKHIADSITKLFIDNP